MKYGQVIIYNMRNILLKESYTEWGGETSPGPFSKEFRLIISLD